MSISVTAASDLTVRRDVFRGGRSDARRYWIFAMAAAIVVAAAVAAVIPQDAVAGLQERS